MSHAATNWALKQRGIKPPAKIVLWHLCDRYNPDNGCFPSQKTLAKDCEMSARSLRDQILILEQAGLTARERRLRAGGSFSSNRYRLAFEDDFVPLATPKANPTNGKIKSSPEASSRHNQGQILPPFNPVMEPIIEPVSSVCSSLQGFDEFWATFAHKKARAKCEAIWKQKRLASQAEEVIEGAAAYVATRGSNPKFWKHPHGWLSDERWTDDVQRRASKHSETFDAVEEAAKAAGRFAA